MLDYLEGYRRTLQNAQELVKVAELAKSVCFGKANSLLILAVEEAVKAGMIYSRHFDPNSEEPSFDKYFKDHKFKHNATNAIERMGNLFEEMSNVMMEPIQQKIEERGELLTKEEAQEEYTKAWERLEKFLTALNAEIDEGGLPDANDNWWNQANDKKNKGLYVTLNKGTQKWETPGDITERQYQQSYEIVTGFINRIALAEERSKEPWFQEAYRKWSSEKEA